MPRPWDLTIEQASAEGERLRAERERADKLAAPLLAQQIKDYDWVMIEVGPPSPPHPSSSHGRKPRRSVKLPHRK